MGKVGRPLKEIVHDFKERLSWFSLEKYQAVKDLSIYGWYLQIAWRRDVYNKLLYASEKKDNQHKLTLLKELGEDYLQYIGINPIVTPEWLNDMWQPVEFFTRICEHRKNESYRDPFVHPTTVEEFYLAEARIGDARAGSSGFF